MNRLITWLYDLILLPAEWPGLRRWRRATVAAVRGRVLEVGAGTGLNLPHYREATTLVVTDVAIEMLRRARARARTGFSGPVYFAVADAQALPFRGEVFDAAVATLTFCTIPDARQAFAELRRVVRPGGEICLLEHVRAPRRWLARLQDWLTPVWRHIAGGCHLNRQTLAVARQAGLRVEETVTGVWGILIRARLR
ncbi:MAG: methyltransferase domain-containing protein, partial [Armatimonadetes bacterium]|nr:methyltransferase domain-containing protein [Armatimonadota bacterium]